VYSIVPLLPKEDAGCPSSGNHKVDASNL
jgi:hypothetical protein